MFYDNLVGDQYVYCNTIWKVRLYLNAWCQLVFMYIFTHSRKAENNNALTQKIDNDKGVNIISLH